MASEVSEIEIETKLIELVREKRLLYDKRLDNYRSKTLRTRAWEEVGLQLNLRAIKCKTLWTNLRSQYMAQRRKLKNPSGSGSGSRPYYRHELSMQFLSDAEGEETTFSNLPDMENASTSDENQLSVPPSAETNDQSENGPALDPESTPVARKPNNDDHRAHAKFGKKRKMEGFDEELLKYLKSDESDEFKTFGSFVAFKLQKINTANSKLFSQTQLKITTILLEAEAALN